MTDENKKRLMHLLSRYPRVFDSSQLDWGLEHKSGWDELLDTMAMRIAAILGENGNGKIELLQVKEKFGELRVYYRLKATQGDTAAAIAETVYAAQEASAHVCEVCGQPGTLLRGKMTKTRCTSCASM